MTTINLKEFLLVHDRRADQSHRGGGAGGKAYLHPLHGGARAGADRQSRKKGCSIPRPTSTGRAARRPTRRGQPVLLAHEYRCPHVGAAENGSAGTASGGFRAEGYGAGRADALHTAGAGKKAIYIEAPDKSSGKRRQGIRIAASLDLSLCQNWKKRRRHNP